MCFSIFDLTEVEATAVRYFRLWYDGTNSKRIVEKNFIISLGYMSGYKAARSFGALCDVLKTEGRRDLVRYPIASNRVGLGERCFSKLIQGSMHSDRDSSMLICFFLVSPDFAPILYKLAQNSALAIKRMY